MTTDGPGLEVTVEKRGSATVVAPQGEIAYAEATPFRATMRRVMDERPARVVIDLARVDYMNTPGLAVMVEALQAARKGKTRLVLCGITPKVKAILQIARLNTVFEIVDTLEGALA
jgi:anti-sigma B factor antagonist